MDHEQPQKALYERNFNKYGLDMNVFVSLVSALLVLSFSVFTIARPRLSASFFGGINALINKNFSWLFVLTINAAFVFLIILGVSKFGKIRLGGYTTKPEYGDVAWYAMLFSAGIGIGIFFYGVAEPIYHLSLPESLQTSSPFDNFKMMYIHWGAHAWAVYGLLAIGLGYFSYNRKLPFALRSLFYPLLKDKIFGIVGDIIDTVAVLAVLFGLAASLGLGAQQINSGLHYVLGVPISGAVQVGLIVVITFFATLSVVSGVSRGIKWLSEANIIVSGLLLLGITLLGPTAYIFATYFSSFGLYLKEFFNAGFFTAIQPEEVAWQGRWTIFYWAWWISWAPFVGTFIARISKGRTIREVALGTILVPTIIITLAMTILGAAGININNYHNNVIADAVERNVATSIFEMFRYISSSTFLQYLLSGIAIISIILFFVTSSDSGSLVVSSLTSGGRVNPPKAQKIFWSAMEGLIALSVLLIGGEEALETIQSAVIILGLPFALILITIMLSLKAELRASYRRHRFNEMIKLKESLEEIDDDTEFR